MSGLMGVNHLYIEQSYNVLLCEYHSPTHESDNTCTKPGLKQLLSTQVGVTPLSVQTLQPAGQATRCRAEVKYGVTTETG